MPKPEATARNLQIRTPGAPVAPPDDGLGETDADALAADASEVAIPDAPAVEAKTAEPAAQAAMSPADLMAFIQREVAKGVAEGLAAAKRASMPAAVELPDQSEVDPAKITSLTLTKQGYVVPLDYGRAPKHLLQHQVQVQG